MATRTRDARRSESRPESGVNVVVLRGHLSSDPAGKQLPSGDELWQYEVTVREPEGATASVPVVLVGGRSPAGVQAGSEVVVTGRVRRRFFRAGGATASRTEVVADRVVAARRRGVDRAVDGALERLDDLR